MISVDQTPSFTLLEVFLLNLYLHFTRKVDLMPQVRVINSRKYHDKVTLTHKTVLITIILPQRSQLQGPKGTFNRPKSLFQEYIPNQVVSPK